MFGDGGNPAVTLTKWAVKNTAGSEAPPCAVLQVRGIDADGSTVLVKQPDGAAKAAFLVNLPAPVPPGGFGMATSDPATVVAYDGAGGTPAAGGEWGPRAGSWYLNPNQTGWLIFGGATLRAGRSDGLVMAARAGGGGGADCQGTFDFISDLCVYADNATNVTSAPAAGAPAAQLTTADRNRLVDASAGPAEVVAPDDMLLAGQEIRVEKTDASANEVYVLRGGYAPFSGAQGGTARSREIAVVLRAQFDAVTLFKAGAGGTDGQRLGAGLAGNTVWGNPPTLRIKDSVGGAAGPAMPHPGDRLGASLTGNTY
jgi:hypothetical protein